jgi:hypothetical protein
VRLLGGRFRSPYHVGNEHFVLLEHAHLVAFLAGEVPVLAHPPRLERLLHHMALRAELGIFPGVFVIAESDDPSQHRDEQEQQHNRLLIFLDKTLAE